MPTLPTAADVIALTGTGLSEAVVGELIADAALIGGECVEAYGDPRYTSIIKWLAAHLVASTDAGGGNVTSEKLGDASTSYGRAALADGLAGTIYGQQAKALDVNKCLTGVGRASASVEVI